MKAWKTAVDALVKEKSEFALGLVSVSWEFWDYLDDTDRLSWTFGTLELPEGFHGFPPHRMGRTRSEDARRPRLRDRELILKLTDIMRQMDETLHQ